ncbi:MAG: hypothetical protein LBJ16_02290 [Holosporaceae bacterium]|nr:hypothetical protein [Holosporaceae bacterium]
MVHDDPSTEATQKLPEERMFRKKSSNFPGKHSGLSLKRQSGILKRQSGI